MPGYPTDRVIVYNRDASFAFELTPDEQRSRMRVEQINDEHSLTIKTTRKLAEGMRLITQDDTGKVREHVVYKSDEGHSKGKYAIGTYLCMWSLQYDLMSSYAREHAEPGMGSSCTSRNAVIVALDGQSLWTVGTCDVPAVAAGKGCVMIGVSDWERLSLVVKYWHGEIDAEIVMDDTRVVSRKVNFRAHLGSSEVTRRFDWGEDLTSISRTPDPGPYYCRVVPLGRGQREYAEDDETEFDWPIDITEETGGVEYIEDSESALVFRTKLPDGTYHYPTKVVKYDEDDPELLLNAATNDLHNHTRPGCSYEANVLQFVRAGMDAKGVQLGDNTQCIDFGFNPDAGLTVEGRVTRIEVEELSPETKTNLTIGDLAPTFAQTMRELIGRETASVSDGVKRVEGGGTIAYVEGLLDSLNAMINAIGGYTYLVAGEGAITYDKAVADPLIGVEATQVVQIKGGNIRIANSKKPSFSGINDWQWKTVLQSGSIASELITAARITAGYIGRPTDDFYVNFDTREFSLGASATLDGRTVDQVVNTKIGIANLVRNGDFSNSTNLWKMINVNSYSVVNDSPRVGGKSLQVVMYGAGSLNRCICPHNKYIGSSEDNFNHVADRTYSISFWAKSNSANKITCCGGWYASSGATPQQRLSYVWQDDIDTTWRQYTGTLNTDLGSGSKLTGPINFLLVNAGTLYITDVMIVEGEKPICTWAPDIRDAEKIIDDALTQEDIFNKLTNNGETQGIYLQNGKVYINASYIQSGMISGDYIKGGTIDGTVLTSKSEQYVDGGYYQTTIHNGCISMTYPGATGEVNMLSSSMLVGTGQRYAALNIATRNTSTNTPYGLGMKLSPDIFEISDLSNNYVTPVRMTLNGRDKTISMSNKYSTDVGGNLYMSTTYTRLTGYYGSAEQYIEFSDEGVKIRSGNKGMKLSINSNTWTPIVWS